MRHFECVCAGRCRAERLVQSGCCIATVTAVIRPSFALFEAEMGQFVQRGWFSCRGNTSLYSLLLVSPQRASMFAPPTFLTT